MTPPNEILERVFATTHFCIVCLDRDLNFVRVNRAYADICGHPPEFFVGKNHFALYPSEEFEAVFRKVVATGRPFTIYANPFEFHDHPERGVTYWDWTLDPIRDQDGAVTGLLFALLDVTARRQSEETLRASEQLHRLVLDHVDEVVYMLTVVDGSPFAGNVEFVSRQVEDLLGYEPNEFLADPERWFTSLHPEDVPAAAEATSKILSSKHVGTRVYRMRHKTSGEYHWIEDRVVPRVDQSGKVVALFGVARDVTARRRGEHVRHALWRRLLRLRDEERRRIAGELHDTTAQNLAALTMNLDLLLSALPDDPQCQRLLTDCRQLADHSAQEIRTLSYLLHPPLLDEFGAVRAIRDFADGFSRRSGIRVELDVPHDPGRFTAETEIALFRVVQESLANVHRHSGSPVAHIHMARHGDHLVLEVRDEGRGLPADLVDGLDLLGATAGVGMLGMRERVEQLGGRLELGTGVPGALVRVIIPVKEPTQ